MLRVTLLTATWCPVCPEARRLWRQLALAYAFDFEEIDVSSAEGKRLAQERGLTAVPSTLFNGKVVFTGAPEPQVAAEALEDYGAEVFAACC